MARIITTTKDEKGVDQRVVGSGPVKVETPSGQVFISYDANMGAVIVVKGDKSSTTVKFNDKAV